MHVLIALITAVVSLLWALNRFGVDIHSLNPFAWRRRAQWRRKFSTKPIHNLHKPLDAAAVLAVGIIQSEGLVSREQKASLLDIFRQELKQDTDTAHDLFGASVFMLKDIMDVAAEVPQILAPCKQHFTEQQAHSLLHILKRVATLEGEMTAAQQSVILAVERELLPQKKAPGEW